MVDCTVSGLTLRGLLTTGSTTDGIFGAYTATASGTKFIDCANYVDITAAGLVAGFVGKSGASHVKLTTEFDNCKNYGAVVNTSTATTNGTGGIIAKGDYTTVINCVNNGNVSGAGRVGGIVGWGENFCEIYNSANYGNVSTLGASINSVSGGIAGRLDSDCVLSTVLNMGTITAQTAGYAAGIVGYVKSDGAHDGTPEKDGTIVKNIFSSGTASPLTAAQQRWFSLYTTPTGNINEAWTDVTAATSAFPQCVGWQTGAPWAPLLNAALLDDSFMIRLNAKVDEIRQIVGLETAKYWGISPYTQSSPGASPVYGAGAKPMIGEGFIVSPPTTPSIITSFTPNVWTNGNLQVTITSGNHYQAEYRMVGLTDGNPGGFAPWGNDAMLDLLTKYTAAQLQGQKDIEIRTKVGTSDISPSVHTSFQFDRVAPVWNVSNPFTLSTLLPDSNITLTANAQKNSVGVSQNIRYFWAFSRDSAQDSVNAQKVEGEAQIAVDKNGWYTCWAVDDLGNGAEATGWDNFKTTSKITNFVGENPSKPELYLETAVMTNRKDASGNWVYYSFAGTKSNYEAGTWVNNGVAQTLVVQTKQDMLTAEIPGTGNTAANVLYIVWMPSAEVSSSGWVSGLTRVHLEHGYIDQDPEPILPNLSRYRYSIQNPDTGEFENPIAWQTIVYGADPYIYLTNAGGNLTGILNVEAYSYTNVGGDKQSENTSLIVRLSDLVPSEPNIVLVSGATTIDNIWVAKKDSQINFYLSVNATAESLSAISFVEWRIVDTEGVAVTQWEKYDRQITLDKSGAAGFWPGFDGDAARFVIQFRQVDRTARIGLLGTHGIWFDYGVPTANFTKVDGFGKGTNESPYIGELVTINITDVLDGLGGVGFGANPVMYSLNGQNYYAIAKNGDMWQYSIIPDFNGTVYFRVMDLAGNELNQSFRVVATFNVPRIDITIELNNTWTTGNTKNTVFDVRDNQFPIVAIIYAETDAEPEENADWTPIADYEEEESKIFEKAYGTGTHYIFIKNSIGAVIGVPFTVSFFFDNTNPTIDHVIFTDEAGDENQFGEILTFEIIASDAEQSGVREYWYKLGDAEFVRIVFIGNDFKFTLEETEFKGVLTVKVVDLVGLSAQESFNITITTKPRVANVVVELANIWLNATEKNVTITADWDEYAATHYILNGAQYAITWDKETILEDEEEIEIDTKHFTIALGAGDYELYIKNAEELLSSLYEFSVGCLDTTNPEFTYTYTAFTTDDDDIDTPTPNSLNGERVEFYVTPTDENGSGIAGVMYSTDGGSTWTAGIKNTDGTWKLVVTAGASVTIRVTDIVGNYTDDTISGLIISSARPIVSVDSPSNWIAETSRDITFFVQAYLDGAVIRYYQINQTGIRGNEEEDWLEIENWDLDADLDDIPDGIAFFTKNLAEGTYYIWVRGFVLTNNTIGFTSLRTEFVVGGLDTDNPEWGAITNNGSFGEGLTVEDPAIGFNVLTFFISATDEKSGIEIQNSGAFGVKFTQTVGGVTSAKVNAVYVGNNRWSVTIAGGTGFITVYVTDKTGVNEITKDLYFTITDEVPSVTAELQPSANHENWALGTERVVNFTFNFTNYPVELYQISTQNTVNQSAWLSINDGLTYDPETETYSKILPSGTYYIWVKNSAQITGSRVQFIVNKLDDIAPVIASVTHNGINSGLYTDDRAAIVGELVIQFNATDSQSGVQKIEYKLGNGTYETVAIGEIRISGFSGLVTIRVTDNVGHTATHEIWVYATETLPTVTATVANAETWVATPTKSVNFQITCDGCDVNQYRIIGYNVVYDTEWIALTPGEIAAMGWSLNLPAGVYNVHIKNLYGIAGDPYEFTVKKIDTFIPEILYVGTSVESFDNAAQTSTLKLLIYTNFGSSGNPDDQYCVTLTSAQPGQDANWQSVILLSNDGGYYLWARNNAGSISVPKFVEKWPPYAVADVAHGNEWTTDKKEVEIKIITAGNNVGAFYLISNVQYFIPTISNAWSPWQPGTRVLLAEGDYYLWVRDNNNHISYYADPFTIDKIDNQNPNIRATVGDTNPADITVTVWVTRGQSKIKYDPATLENGGFKIWYLNGTEWVNITEIFAGAVGDYSNGLDGERVIHLNDFEAALANTTLALTSFNGVWKLTLEAESGRTHETSIFINADESEIVNYINYLIDQIMDDGIGLEEQLRITDIEVLINALELQESVQGVHTENLQKIKSAYETAKNDLRDMEISVYFASQTTFADAIAALNLENNVILYGLGSNYMLEIGTHTKYAYAIIDGVRVNFEISVVVLPAQIAPPSPPPEKGEFPIMIIIIAAAAAGGLLILFLYMRGGKHRKLNKLHKAFTATLSKTSGELNGVIQTYKKYKETKDETLRAEMMKKIPNIQKGLSDTALKSDAYRAYKRKIFKEDGN
jgi:hypothetical protein